MGKSKKRLVFDIETDQFSEHFRTAKTPEARRKHAPKLRIACVFDEADNAYRFYTSDDGDGLVEDLLAADELISFNGKGFDLFVLQRHCGLNAKQSVPKKGMHVDMHEIITKEAGFRVSLHKAVQVNFGERKHTDGRAMDALSLEQLKEACHSDVLQTYRLYKAHIAGKLLIHPKEPRRWYVGPSGDDYGGPGMHIPETCPICHDVGSVEFVPADTEDMTEGQLAEYLAGTWGYLFCSTCQHQEVWAM